MVLLFFWIIFLVNDVGLLFQWLNIVLLEMTFLICGVTVGYHLDEVVKLAWLSEL